MKKILISMLMLTVLLASASAATLNRNVAASVAPGQQFTVTYQTSLAPLAPWFVAWEETVTGGCTPNKLSDFMANSVGGEKSSTTTFTAPASGSCTFSGYYQYSEGALTYFPEKIVAISSVCTPNCACASATCTTTTCSNGCGGTCPGTKSCTTCEPDWNMGEWSTCSGGTQTRTVTDLNNCGVNTDKPETSQSCSTTCTPNCDDKECGTNGCGGSCGSCEEGFKCSSGECKEEINIFEEYWWAFLIGGFILLLVVLKK